MQAGNKGFRRRSSNHPQWTELLEPRRLLSSSPAAPSASSAPAQAADVRSVDIGDVVSGSVQAGVDSDENRFTAAAGRRIYLDVLSLGGVGRPLVDFQLLDPSGALLASSSAFVDSPDDGDYQNAVTLAADGQYKLVVSVRGESGAADYSLRISDAPLETKPYAVGDTASGSIEAPGATDQWRFDAAAGRRVYLDVLSLANPVRSLVDFDLYAPDGTDLIHRQTFTDDPDGGDFPDAIVLPQAGQYTLVVDARRTDLAEYSFRINDAPLETKTYSIGEAASGAIEVPGATDQWNFNGSAGQRVYLQVLSLTNPVRSLVDFDLYDPDGNAILHRQTFTGEPEGGDSQDAIVLPQTGQYTLVVDARRTDLADYSFRINDAPLDVRTINIGDVVEGAVEVPGATDEYRFNATAGRRVYFDVLSVTSATGARLDFDLYGPDGAHVLGTRSSSDSPDDADRGFITLGAAGQYRLVVDARRAQVADYRLQIAGESDMRVGGSAWTPAFRNAMTAAGLGNGGYDYRVGVPTKPAPWANLNQISITYDKDIVPKPGDLKAFGRTTGGYSATGVSYDAATRTATWTLSRPLGDDFLTVLVEHGNAAQFSVFPGDVDQSGGSVNASDLVLTRNRIGRSLSNHGAGPTAYSLFNDLNGDGVINAADLVLVRNRVGTSLPAVAPSLVFSALWIAPEEPKRMEELEASEA